MGRRFDKPRGLAYHGGKSNYYGKSSWICEQLPEPIYEQLYAEPYGGMAGVMMERQRVRTEIYNDLNGRLVNWWLAVRDEPDEFARLVRLTPRSEQLYEEAIEQVDDESLPPIRRALAFHILLSYGIDKGGATEGGGFYLTYATDFDYAKYPQQTYQRIPALAARMEFAQIIRRPAVSLLADLADIENAVIYCDPPYPNTNTNPYAYGDIDKDELTEALLAQRGFCAISGYGDEWEHLGWRREERKALFFSKRGASDRLERLWLNGQSPRRRLF